MSEKKPQEEEVIDMTKENEEIEGTEEGTQEKVEEAVSIEETLKKELEAKETEVKDAKDRMQRTLAEFENFRKRSTREKSMMFENGAKETLEAILPVIDNFERALSSCDEGTKQEPFAQGVEMIYKQLTGALESIGVTAIEAEGNEFDPNFHNAVTHVEDDTLGENVVAEEFQKGYMYKDTVLRYSMVKVAN